MRLVSGPAALLAVSIAATGFPSPAAAATFNVSGVAGLRSALATAASNGQDDVIVLAAGTYATGGTTFTFVTNETNTLTLKGADGTTRDQVILDGGGNTQVLNFSCVGSCASMITLQGLTVQNGFVDASGNGAGIASNILTLSDVDINHNGSGRSGGAISSDKITVTNSSFRGNASLWGGDGGAISGSGTVANSSFSNNVAAGGSGGAISGDITVTNSTFSDNWSYGGGAISGSGTVTDSTFSNNLSRGSGGAIRGSWTVANSVFNSNKAYGGSGGAIDGDIAVTNSTFSNNSALGRGGAINGSGTISNSIFSNNTVGPGDGGAIGGNMTVTNSTFSNNWARYGGAIDGSGLVVNSTFSENGANVSGAAIYLSSATGIINSVFYGHTTPAIHAGSAYNLYNSLIDTETGIAGSPPLMVGNVAPGATSPFVDAANGNFQLAAGSLAIDAGLDPDSATFANLVGSSNAAAIRQALLTDLQGNPRPTPGTAVDMGAYEFGAAVANPYAPTITGVSQNYGSATIRVTTPPPFASYTVTCTAPGQTARTATGTRSTITVQGLTGGVSYSCSVTGSNGTSTSAPSAAVPVEGRSVVPMMQQLLFD